MNEDIEVKRQKIERITIEGPQSRSDEIFEFCNRNNYWITRSGPKQIDIMKYDTDILLIIAEKEIE